MELTRYHMALWADGRLGRGAGHLVRTRVLAEAFMQRGHSVTLYSNENSEAVRSAWGNLDWQIDDGSLSCSADIRIADGYDCVPVSNGQPLVRIHDAAQQPMPTADLLIDPGLDADPASYPQAIPLCGPAFSLLRPVFSAQTWQAKDSESPIVIVPGGGDAGGLLPSLLPLLDSVLPPTQTVHIIGMDALSAGIPLMHSSRFKALGWLSADDIAKQLAQSRLAITTASTAALEALAVGCPLWAIQVIDNQAGIARSLQEFGVQVGQIHELSSEQLALALESAPFTNHRMDGLGAQRAVRRIEQWLWCHTHGDLSPVRWSDMQALYAWQQDPGVRAASLVGGEVSLTDHQRWLRRRLGDPHALLFMAKHNDQTVGSLRLQWERQDRDLSVEEATVSIAIAPEVRGQGWGPKLLTVLAKFVRAHKLAQRVRALVRCDNPASLRCFAKAGYQRAQDTFINTHQTAVFYADMADETC